LSVAPDKMAWRPELMALDVDDIALLPDWTARVVENRPSGEG
jgi:hypothetical protein